MIKKGRRGAAAGLVAAAAWAASEPLFSRISGTSYTDVRLLGRLATPGRWSWPVGFAAHLVNGAAFGAAFERFGGRGWKQGVAAAQVENLLLWPGMAVIDRVHPDRRSGAWPPLLLNGRIFAQEVAVHTLFGAVLGLLVDD